MTARGQMLIAANMAGAASNAQVGIVHALAHTVGAKFKVHHGLANSILLPPCLRYNADACGDVYLDILSAMGVSVEKVSQDEAGNAGRHDRRFYQEIRSSSKAKRSWSSPGRTQGMFGNCPLRRSDCLQPQVHLRSSRGSQGL